jgi:hypothetical protein
MADNDDALNGGDKIPLFQQGDNTDINKKLDTTEKGIQLFFGDAEERFFQEAGREITEKVLLESFILYRVDLSKTRTHKLYGESKFKKYLEPVEIFARINVESESPSYAAGEGLIKKGFGKLTANVYLSHLEELDVKVRMGDFVYHKGNYYEITDDGSSNTSNEYAYGGDRFFYMKIEGVRVTKDKFEGR